VTLEGWIFMVGLRVFDIGALVVWLVWFYRLRDDDDGDQDPPPPTQPGGGIPLPDAEPWPHRRRDHGGDRTPLPVGRRRSPAHAPSRVPALPRR
jgi:hypothetical protein